MYGSSVERGLLAPADVAALTSNEPVYLSPIAIAELRFGAEVAQEPRIRQRRLAALHRIRRKPLVVVAGDIFGSLAAQISAAGRQHRERLAERLAAVRHEQGRLLGRMEGLGFKLRQEAVLQILTDDVLKSSEIEGEYLDAEQVRSSLARRLGMNIGGLKDADRKVEGVVEMMLDATRHYDERLTAERLFAWHASLFPTGPSGMRRIRVGAWRDDSGGPMQVVSGPIGRERAHFEAPGAGRLGREMQAFLDWFNGQAETDWVVKAGLAHLWFVTIHPFDDGNGRIARAIADLALARSEQSSQCFYSMSVQIRQERAAYYYVLEQTQKGTTDITPWMDWFLGCLGRAIEGAQATFRAILSKARFWEAIADFPLNERQRLVLNRLLDDFEGKLTTSKWAKLAKCSQDTALRDILPLVERGVLVRNPAGGRSASYALAKIAADSDGEKTEPPRGEKYDAVKGEKK